MKTLPIQSSLGCSGKYSSDEVLSSSLKYDLTKSCHEGGLNFRMVRLCINILLWRTLTNSQIQFLFAPLIGNRFDRDHVSVSRVLWGAVESLCSDGPGSYVLSSSL